MHLYSLTLQQSTSIIKAIYGNFSGPKALEIVVSRGKQLELLRPDETTNKLQTILVQEVFGIIRSLAAFRLTGSNRDYIIAGSDSGKVVILQYDAEKNVFNKVHQETFGKTGCRRIVPGQYLATDPRGRAFMIAAVEKQKFVYILNRDSKANLTISSPLEAHKSHTINFDITGIDVGYENPLFACIEADYGEVENKESAVNTGQIEKYLTFYELDLGLNHVVRKSQESLPESAHMLIPVPGYPQGPSGVIVCCENFLIYKPLNGQSKICPYPMRVGSPTDRQILINCYSSHQQKDFFFFLLQTELGDLLKLTLNFTKEEVHSIQMQYFDSIPVANSLCILKTGYLFSSCEFGNHQYYLFVSIGDEENPVMTDSTMKKDDIVQFYPRELKNLQLNHELDNLSTITDMKVEDLTGEGFPQIYTLCAANSRSTLRILRHGLAVTEMAVSAIPGIPTALWTIKENNLDSHHKYIVLSFSSQTLVLSIGEKVVREVSDTGIDAQKNTLHVFLMEDNAIIQVTPLGIRHIRRDKRIHQWQTNQKIVQAASNQKQLIVALSGGELVYFELDSLGQLAQIEKITLDSEVVSLDIGSIPEHMTMCKFLAVGLSDLTVRLFSLDPDSYLQRLSTQALPSIPESVNLIEMKSELLEEGGQNMQLYLHVGLQNGVLLRTAVDQITGNLTDTRTRFLGSRPVKLFKIQIQKQTAMLALSSRPWVCYSYLSKYVMVPLSYEGMDQATSFSSPGCSEGIVGTSGNTLRIITPERLGEVFNQTVVPLRYSPRKIVIHPESHFLIIVETEHRTYSQKDKESLKLQYYGDNEEALNVSEQQVGNLRAPPGTWGSCLRVLDPIDQKTLDILEMDFNQAAFSAYITSFSTDGQLFLLVGVVQDLYLTPKGYSNCFINTYIFNEQGTKLILLHQTPVEDIPYSFAAFRGKLLVGAGKSLRLYDMGKKRLLKKAELRGFQTGVNNIQLVGDRIFVTDLSDSVHVLKFKQSEQTFYEVCDDILPRWATSVSILDYNTCVIADKFQNMSVLRLPTNVDEEIVEDTYSYSFKGCNGYLNGAPYKFENICNFYVGEVVTSLQKTSLVSTSNEIILFATSLGSIGAFYPFETKEDVDFFVHLEMYLRIESLPLSGRDHLQFRSAYNPIKNVIDGDLCEQFARVGYSKSRVMSEEMDRTPAEVLKKLEDIRNRIL